MRASRADIGTLSSLGPASVGSPFGSAAISCCETENPAGTAEMRQGDKVLFRITFKKGREKIAWSEIPLLPKDLREGLPPGKYTLAMKDKTAR